MARLGRSFPRRATFVRSKTAAGQASNGSADPVSGGGEVVNSGTKHAHGSAVTSGGGGVTASGTKHAIGTTTTAGGGAIVNVAHKTPEPGAAVTSGGGSASGTGTKHAHGSAVTSGGGSASGSGTKSVSGSATPASGGGSANQTGTKSAHGATSTTGGGEVTCSGHVYVEPVVVPEVEPEVFGPNWSGFADAQVRLRANFNRDVEFFVFTEPVYASGVVLDPETSRPYDPSVRPTASGVITEIIGCNLVDRPMGLSQSGVEDQRRAGTPLGSMAEYTKVAIISVDEVGIASAATAARYLGVDYRVTDFRLDALGPVERYLAFLESR